MPMRMGSFACFDAAAKVCRALNTRTKRKFAARRSRRGLATQRRGSTNVAVAIYWLAAANEAPKIQR